MAPPDRPFPPAPPEAERLAAVRAALPALDAGIYLNTALSGPLPAETAAAMDQLQQYELTVGRGHIDAFHDFVDRMAEARATIAALLVADPDDIALTHGTTDGLDIGVFGLDWRAGDRAVTTRLDHARGSGPLVLLRERWGIETDALDVGDGGDHERVREAFGRAIDGRTKAVVISHVVGSNGAVMPVRAIADLAHERGALVVVDGAHSAGSIPVDLGATGADVYALPGHRWLLGPEGTGAVAVTATARERLAPSRAGWHAFQPREGDGPAAFWPTARRYEGSSFHRPSVVGLARSVGWLSMFIGLDWIHERGPRLAGWTHDRLSAIPGVTVITPREHMATLVTFRIAGWTPDDAMAELGARVFSVIGTAPLVDALRVSVGFFNSEDELERFCAAVELLAAHTPTTMPPRRTLTMLGEG